MAHRSVKSGDQENQYREYNGIGYHPFDVIILFLRQLTIDALHHPEVYRTRFAMYMERSRAYVESGVDDDWTGVDRLDFK